MTTRISKPLFLSHIVFVLWHQNASDGHCNRVTNNSQLTTEISTELGDIIFAERGHQKIIKVIMLIKITEESVKFIEIKSIQSNVKLRI